MMRRSKENAFFAWALLLLCFSFISNQSVHGKVLTEVPRNLQNLCSDINAPALEGRQHAKLLTWLLQATSESGLTSKASPQHQAACYMIFQDPMRKKVRSNRAAFRQRYALSVFFIATKGLEDWYPDVGNPNATTSAVKDEGAKPWLGNTHECTWYGVRCSTKIPFVAQTVTGLDITFFGVGGILPRELALLNNLKEVDLHGNDLQGVLPHMAVVNWKQMESLRLHMNGFFGNLLKEMGNMKNMKELILFGNYFAGTIPRELSKMKKLGACVLVLLPKSALLCGRGMLKCQQ